MKKPCFKKIIWLVTHFVKMEYDPTSQPQSALRNVIEPSKFQTPLPTNDHHHSRAVKTGLLPAITGRTSKTKYLYNYPF
jgi:hypothetical protein